MIQKFLIPGLVLPAIFILTGFGGVSGMNIFTNDFEKKWDELSQNVNILNEYTAHHPIELRDIKVKKRNLDGAIFTGANFSSVEWEAITSKCSKYTKVVFARCKFNQCNFSYSKFTDVVFKDCEFINTDINRSYFVNVQFQGCNLTQMGLVDNRGDTLTLVKCQVLDSGMGDCNIDFSIKDTILDGVDMSTSEGEHKIFIQGGLLSEVDFGNSHFSDVILRRVRQGEGGVKFNDLTANSMRFEDVNMTRGTAIARSKVKSVSINGGNFGTTFAHSMIGQIYIRDANLTYTDFCEAKLPKVTISNCHLYNTGMWDGHIEELAVYNSEFNIIDGENFMADLVAWDNVTLDGRIDLTNAQIKDFRLTRLKRGPRLQLITTGSNIRF